MPQIDIDGANSRLSADNIRGQSGSTITIVSGHNLVGSGSGLTALNATQLTSGTVPTARLGSGTANNGVFLRGDGTWAAAGVTGISSSADATAITIDSSERVGINETSPEEYLHISGNNPTIRIDAAGHPNDGKILFTDDGSSTERAQIYYDTEGVGVLCIENMNDNANADISIGVRRNGSFRESIRIKGDGVIKNSWTPYYLAWGGLQSNVTGTGNTVNVTMTGRIDQGTNVSSNTFTAPQTGRYLICSSVHVEGVTSNATAVGHNIITSNRTYGSFIYDSGGDLTEYHNIKNAVVADMDAGDTAYLQCRIADMSSNTADLGSGSGYHYWSVTMVA